jgi:hypothetical protein
MTLSGARRDYHGGPGRGYSGGGNGRYEDRSNRGHGGRGGRGGGRSPDTPRPTECNVVTNSYKLEVLDPTREVGLSSYEVTIKSASRKVKKDENGVVIKSETGRPLYDFVARETSVCNDEKFAKRFFASDKPMRIFKSLVEDERRKNSSFTLAVSKMHVWLSLLW